MSDASPDHAYARRYTDLLSERVGGRALSCSDQWFAPCDNLVKTSEPVFKEGHFVSTGQWMDGWESRRSYGRAARRAAGSDHDWCILKLGIAGTVKAVDVETTHFRGNAPEFASVEGAWFDGQASEEGPWLPLLPRSAIAAHQHNVFELEATAPCTHLRLKMFPDGGVSRLRAWGEARVMREHYAEGELLDLASVRLGGRGGRCSDEFYSSPSNLLMPYPGVNMGDGWETRRRRDEGNDWCVIALGISGSIRKLVIDTAHFKGNYPDTVSVDAALCPRGSAEPEDSDWECILPRSPVQADQEHIFVQELLCSSSQHFSHVRLNIFPDGGVSRLRVIGSPDWGPA